jgi:hypothetical protein
MKTPNIRQAILQILALVAAASMAGTTQAQQEESAERAAHMEEITKATSKFYDSRDFKYPCNRHLMDFPERYDDLNNLSSARANWNRAYAAADNFKSCVNGFLTQLPSQKVETVVPVYRYLNSWEKQQVAERFVQGIASLKNTIDKGMAKVDEELEAVAESQGRMSAAKDAGIRARAENRRFMQDVARSLNDLAEATKPRLQPPSIVASDDKGGSGSESSTSDSSDSIKCGFFLSENAGVASDPEGTAEYRRAAAANNAAERARGHGHCESKNPTGPGKNTSR